MNSSKKNPLTSLEFTDLEERKEKNLEQLRTESELNKTYLNALTGLIENPSQDSCEFNKNLSDVVYEWDNNLSLLEEDLNHEPRISLLVHNLNSQRWSEALFEVIQDLQSQIRQLRKTTKTDPKSSKTKKSSNNNTQIDE